MYCTHLPRYEDPVGKGPLHGQNRGPPKAFLHNGQRQATEKVRHGLCLQWLDSAKLAHLGSPVLRKVWGSSGFRDWAAGPLARTMKYPGKPWDMLHSTIHSLMTDPGRQLFEACSSMESMHLTSSHRVPKQKKKGLVSSLHPYTTSTVHVWLSSQVLVLQEGSHGIHQHTGRLAMTRADSPRVHRLALHRLAEALRGFSTA